MTQKFKKGYIRGVTLLKNTDGLLQLSIKVDGNYINVLSKFKEQYDSAELLGQEVLLNDNLRATIYWKYKREIIKGVMSDDLYSVLLLTNGKYVLN